MDEKRAGWEGKSDSSIPWERDLVEKLVMASSREQRRTRRWSIFFRFLIFIYLFALLAMMFSDGFDSSDITTGNHTALIEIDGVIATKEIGVTADQVIDGLKEAYKDEGTKGIVIRINSPGGSPVQSARLYSEIRRLKKEHEDIPVYVVIEDVGASGGYYIAAAADEIYANESSIVGSIGVRMGSFGFVDVMEKIGVDRRVLTAGDNKNILDPFLPVNEADEEHAKAMLDEVHEQFIAAVREGRGDRLKESDDIFSGLFWSGRTAKEYGLIDGFGDAAYVARELVKEETLVDFTTKGDPFERLARKFGIGVGEAMIQLSGPKGISFD